MNQTNVARVLALLLFALTAGCEDQSGLAVDPECQAMDCRYNGNCSYVGGYCRVTSDRDCRQATPCKVSGHCTFRNGGCVSGSSADCRQSDLCRDVGLCTYDSAHGYCIRGSEADCRQSWACRMRGVCNFTGSSCSTEGSTDMGPLPDLLPHTD